MCHVKRMKGGRQCQQLCGTLQCATLERMANRTVEIPRRWERFVDHAPSTQRSLCLPSHSTDETKVLNKVHQCVLFTKAKRRCHNLTHTLHAHTHPLTDSATTSHTRTCRAWHALPCQAQEESFEFMQPCCLLGLMTLQRSVSASATPCSSACATACVCV